MSSSKSHGYFLLCCLSQCKLSQHFNKALSDWSFITNTTDWKGVSEGQRKRRFFNRFYTAALQIQTSFHSILGQQKQNSKIQKNYGFKQTQKFLGCLPSVKQTYIGQSKPTILGVYGHLNYLMSLWYMKLWMKCVLIVLYKKRKRYCWVYSYPLSSWLPRDHQTARRHLCPWKNRWPASLTYKSHITRR